MQRIIKVVGIALLTLFGLNGFSGRNVCDSFYVYTPCDNGIAVFNLSFKDDGIPTLEFIKLVTKQKCKGLAVTSDGKKLVFVNGEGKMMIIEKPLEGKGAKEPTKIDLKNSYSNLVIAEYIDDELTYAYLIAEGVSGISPCKVDLEINEPKEGAGITYIPLVPEMENPPIKRTTNYGIVYDGQRVLITGSKEEENVYFSIDKDNGVTETMLREEGGQMHDLSRCICLSTDRKYAYFTSDWDNQHSAGVCAVNLETGEQFFFPHDKKNYGFCYYSAVSNNNKLYFVSEHGGDVSVFDISNGTVSFSRKIELKGKKGITILLPIPGHDGYLLYYYTEGSDRYLALVNMNDIETPIKDNRTEEQKKITGNIGLIGEFGSYMAIVEQS